MPAVAAISSRSSRGKRGFQVFAGLDAAAGQHPVPVLPGADPLLPLGRAIRMHTNNSLLPEQ